MRPLELILGKSLPEWNSAHIKGTPKVHSYPLSMVEGCSEKSANYEESSHQNPTILVLDFQPPELRNEFLLFVSHSVCGILLQLPKQTKTSSNHSCFFFFLSCFSSIFFSKHWLLKAAFVWLCIFSSISFLYSRFL